MNEPDDDRTVRRSALWRIHGLAAILGTPFLVVAAVTGLIYVLAPQVEAWQDGAFDRVAPRHGCRSIAWWTRPWRQRRRAAACAR